GRPWQTGEPWLRRMHGIIAAALAELGVNARPYAPAGEPHFTGVLCFQDFTAGDLLVGPGKVVGSAQRRHRRALLQHGGILLAASPHTPDLPGIRELSGVSLSVPETCSAITREFTRQTGWDLAEGDWTAAERERLQELVTTRYTHDAWNRKR